MSLRALDDPGCGDVSAEGSEDGPCDVELNRVPIVLGEEHTLFEQVVE